MRLECGKFSNTWQIKKSKKSKDSESDKMEEGDNLRDERERNRYL